MSQQAVFSAEALKKHTVPAVGLGIGRYRIEGIDRNPAPSTIETSPV